MSPWIDHLLEVLTVAFRWLQRLYGVFFVGLGLLFFYWAGRGLLAYQHGVRAAWSDPLASLAGLAAGVLSLWAGSRIVRSGLSVGRILGGRGISEELVATLEQAASLERADATAARQLLDAYFMREAVTTETRRAELRLRAPYDLKAALTLEEELREDLSTNASARAEIVKRMPVNHRDSLLAQIDQLDHDLHVELNALEGVIARLRLR